MRTHPNFFVTKYFLKNMICLHKREGEAIFDEFVRSSLFYDGS